jgi:hypothetical protein
MFSCTQPTREIKPRWRDAGCAIFHLEPDSPTFWPPKPHPDVYARLVSEACDAIKTAALQSKVLAPATAALPIRVPSFYKALDGLSMHSYRLAWGRQPDPESVEGDNLNSRVLLESLSSRWRGIPIHCTERGYPS